MRKSTDTTFGSDDMNKHTTKKVSAIAIALFPVALSGLTGCGGLQQQGTTPAIVQGVALHGSIHGGQQPVSGANVQFYAAGSTGYGSAYLYPNGATSLLGTNVVTSDGGGGFSISNDYTCPSPTTQVYLVATGGNPGLGTGTNANLAMMVALGPCGLLSSATDVNVNEMTTVATVWALSPFMTGIVNIGTSAGNAQGLTNAFAAVNKLVNTGSGVVSGPALPAGATLPVMKLNTLADILGSCVNSAGGVAGDKSNCGKLFADTTVGGVAPTDTITAAMNMAQHPGVAVADLFTLSSATAPFEPALPTAPMDLTIGITYASGGLSGPKGVAVDGGGNVWVANSTGNSVTKLDNTGAALSTATGFTGSMSAPSAIAIDASGNAWVTNTGGSTISALTPAGGTLNGSPFTVGTAPNSLAFDALGYLWVANSGSNSVSELSAAGGSVQTISSGASAPGAVAVSPK
jgi:DNA-binding beta-propeller fold protein YncE